jgi:hypothetical protein
MTLGEVLFGLDLEDVAIWVEMIKAYVSFNRSTNVPCSLLFLLAYLEFE